MFGPWIVDLLDVERVENTNIMALLVVVTYTIEVIDLSFLLRHISV